MADQAEHKMVVVGGVRYRAEDAPKNQDDGKQQPAEHKARRAKTGSARGGTRGTSES